MSTDAYKRIAKIFPMLSASTDGEIVNAARAMNKILVAEKIHWTDVAKRIVDGTPQSEEPPFEPTGRRQDYRESERERERARTNTNERQRSSNNYGQRDNARRQTSAWAQDKADVLKAMPRRADLDDWSYEFMESIEDQVVHQGRRLTERQRDKLNEILDKLGLE